MNKKEFKKWVDATVREYNADYKVECLEFQTEGKIILVDKDTAQTEMYKCDAEQFDFATGLAIAYANLRGLEVPIVEGIEEEPKFERVKDGETYWTIEVDTDGSAYRSFEERHLAGDERCFNSNNYFRTRERAEEIAKKINCLLKLERLHDVFCPRYKPV